MGLLHDFALRDGSGQEQGPGSVYSSKTKQPEDKTSVDASAVNRHFERDKGVPTKWRVSKKAVEDEPIVLLLVG